jgi:hypothetical protein
MKNLVKKKPLLGILFVIFIVIAVYGASVLYSVINIGYQTGSVGVNPNIALTGFPPEYSGYITLVTPLVIENNGFYTIKNLEIDIRITADNWQISSLLNGVEIAIGNNIIGTIAPGEIWEDNINVNITNYIPNFAVEDCILLIEVTINLTYQPLVDIPLSFTIEQSESFNAPF